MSKQAGGRLPLRDVDMPSEAEFEDYEADTDFPNIGCGKFRMNARRLEPEEAVPDMILLAIEDDTGN